MVLVLAGLAAYGAVKRIRFGAWLPTLVGLFSILAFLVWAAAGKDASMPLPQLLGTGIILAVPLGFGAMSGLICERVGIINIAIEGQLLAGAFAAAVAASLLGNPYVALIAAPIAGVLVAVLLAFFTI